MTAIDDEFDLHAAWIGEAVRRLGLDDAVAAACRGSASPAALRWLVRACGLRAGDLLVDVGGGMGGPAAFARAETGAVPLVVEPMVGACRAARELFGLTAVAAPGDRLPVADAAAGAVWCLGVLCTTPDDAAIVAELRRVLRPGGALGLLAFVRTVGADALADAPAGNRFPTMRRLHAQLAEADLHVTDSVELAALEPAPAAWQEQADRVEREIAARHGVDPRWHAVRSQQRRMAGVMEDDRVVGWLLRAAPGVVDGGAGY